MISSPSVWPGGGLSTGDILLNDNKLIPIFSTLHPKLKAGDAANRSFAAKGNAPAISRPAPPPPKYSHTIIIVGDLFKHCPHDDHCHYLSPSVYL